MFHVIPGNFFTPLSSPNRIVYWECICKLFSTMEHQLSFGVEKKRELSAANEVIVNLGDIQDKYLSLKIRDKMIDKTTMRNALSLFRRFQLIETLDRDLTNEESRILIYDSILLAVRVEDIRQAYEKLEQYRKGKTANEETDTDEAD